MTDDSSPTSPGPDHGLDGATRALPAVAPWLVLTRSRVVARRDAETPRRILGTVAIGAVVVLVVVGVAAIFAARALAERQAVTDAANTADLLAESVVQPTMTDGVLRRDPKALADLSAAVMPYLDNSALVRVKIWDAGGTVLWSDEPRLIGRTFDRREENTEALANPATRAEVSDLGAPENVFERGQGRLLEAYRPVWTPSGVPVLFETYTPYTAVSDQAEELWRGFAGVTISALLLFCALLGPLLWRVLRRLRAAQRHREDLLEREIEISESERRRIAGTLHDGVVQELAATSFAISGAAERASQRGDERTAIELGAAAGTLRDSIGGLRTLLVDIYPETLESAGLVEVLRDLGSTMRSRDIEVILDLPERDPGLGPDADRVVFRVAHEVLQNVRRHAQARRIKLSLLSNGAGTVLEISDDGIGFDAAEVLARPETGHFGLRVLRDVAADIGAELALRTAPGDGATWRLTLETEQDR